MRLLPLAAIATTAALAAPAVAQVFGPTEIAIAGAKGRKVTGGTTGELLRFTVRNTGGSDLLGGETCVTLPSGFRAVSRSDSETVAKRRWCVESFELAAGGSRTFRVHGTARRKAGKLKAAIAAEAGNAGAVDATATITVRAAKKKR